MKCLMTVLLALALVLPATGCGKKDDPEPPPGSQSDFPRKYPVR